MSTFSTVAPATLDANGVKATSVLSSPSYDQWIMYDHAQTLVGDWTTHCWLSNGSTNQRSHVDLGSGKIIKRIYYENGHSAGANTLGGAKNFTFWGSNSAAAFADTVYSHDTDWTQLTCSQSTFDQHSAADVAEPKYITVTNTTSYRYYALKIADAWGALGYVGLRRVELQIEVPDVSVSADPLVATATVRGNWNLNIAASPIEIGPSYMIGSLSHTPPSARNPELDSKYDCSLLGNGGLEIGKHTVTMSVLGTWLNVGVVASPLSITMTPLGTGFSGEMFSSGTTSKFSIAMTLGGGGTYDSPTFYSIPGVANFVKWSNIGTLDFTIGRDNVAGERPLDWKGWIYALKKLGSRVIAYGQNGVSILNPSGVTYGLQTVHGIGLKGKRAICGTDFEHYFVDREGRLYRLTDSLELLDYSEYLDTLGSSTVMSLDIQNSLIYICDGLVGFVYSIKTKSLGVGPINITGVGVQNGTLYVCASSTISVPVFSICTDIYDMGTRKNKTINSIEMGVDATNDLYATIDYRNDKTAAFSTLAWARVNPNGIAVLPCFGVEFRFRFKLLTYEKLIVDYIKINGVIHNYSYLDTWMKGNTL